MPRFHARRIPEFSQKLVIGTSRTKYIKPALVKSTIHSYRGATPHDLFETVLNRFLREFNREVNSETTLDDFKDELWDTVVKFGEPLLMGTCLDEKARKELVSKLVELRKAQPTTRDDECKGSSTLKQKNCR